MKLPVDFYKYEGLGNNFIVIDRINTFINEKDELLKSQYIKKICCRNFGIGADGLILVLPSTNAIVKMRIFNSDGTEAEMCGNGIRCIGKYLLDQKLVNSDSPFCIETLAGLITITNRKGSDITVDMGKPIFDPLEIPTTMPQSSLGLPKSTLTVGSISLEVSAVGMGNPHLIVHFDDLQNLDLTKLGPILETHKFFPKKTNVHFLKVIDKSHLQIKVWERGCGPTMACGTGACATLVASHLLGYCDSAAEVNLPGGNLYISWPNKESSVFMTGNASLVYKGTFFIKP